MWIWRGAIRMNTSTVVVINPAAVQTSAVKKSTDASVS
jgi:hypothetical protein